jgi:two-component system sensor kinase FixL
MGEMASTLAHELNQPLSAISNYLKGSRKLIDSAPDGCSTMIRDALDKAADQALRAGEIIRRLRDFVARRESERRVESAKKLIEEASALALVGAKDLGVRVRFAFHPTIDLVLADKVQIQQVVMTTPSRVAGGLAAGNCDHRTWRRSARRGSHEIRRGRFSGETF